MKKIIKDNQGYMLIEIVIASVIALVMAYFLIDITLKLVNKNNDYYLNSVFLADKNIVTKEIMDDINSKKLVKVEKVDDNKVILTYDDGTEKNLNIEEETKTITYGNYKKQMSKELNMDEIQIEADGNILKISIPMYSNYSKENYGIVVTTNYSDDLEIILPLITGNADITVTNIKVNGSPATKFPTGSYTVDVNCTGATAEYDHNYKKLKITGVSVNKNANCSPIFTTKSKVYLNNYIKDTLTGTTQGDGKVVNEKGWRYEGKNPNNYVWFNDELWRIIGVFDETSHGQNGEHLTKIIREDSLGSFSWDLTRSNNWATSSLYKLLNGAYYNSTDGTSSGYCYSYVFDSIRIPTECDYRIGGINNIYRPMVKNVTWYLGGYDTNSVSVDNMYRYERDLTFGQYYGSNSKTTTGHIGLMYVSDFGYSILSSDCARYTSLATYHQNICASSSWIKKEPGEWTISHESDASSYSFGIEQNGYVYFKTLAFGGTVRPVLYLDSSVYILDGTGSKAEPYIISM